MGDVGDIFFLFAGRADSLADSLLAVAHRRRAVCHGHRHSLDGRIPVDYYLLWLFSMPAMRQVLLRDLDMVEPVDRKVPALRTPEMDVR